MESFEERLIPRPKTLVKLGGQVKLAGIGKTFFALEAEHEDIRVLEGAKIITEKINALTPLRSAEKESSEKNYEIVIRVNQEDSHFREIGRKEAYYLEVTEERSVLCGYDEGGAFYAAVTFAELLSKVGSEVFVPTVQIVDYPDFARRGHFFECRYGSEFMEKEDWFEAIDYLSTMKANQLTIGVYGCWSIQYDARPAEYLYIPIRKYPQLKTPKNIKYYSVKEDRWVHQDNLLPKMFAKDYLGEVIAYGKKRNVLVKPLFNSLGHNTLIPKTFPEISSKREDGESSGYGFCTETAKTYEVMFDIYDEIIERYLEPNGIDEIAIGLDEVAKDYRCHCEKCSQRVYSELMIDYIVKLCKYLKAKGMRKIFVYHDMLFHEFDAVNEELRERFIREGIYDEVVLDWWTYEDPSLLFLKKADGVNNLFHSIIKPFSGYFNWSIPTEHNENVRACAKLADKLGFEGVEAYGSYDLCYDKNYLTIADVSWNCGEIDREEEFNRRYAYRNYPENAVNALTAFHALSDIMKDETGNRYANKACFKLEYYYYCYNRPWLPYPQYFPESAFEMIQNNEKEYVTYLEFLKEKSKTAIDFFENSGNAGKQNSLWLLTSRHYFTLADEYLTLYRLYRAYQAGLTDEFALLQEVERLLEQRESLMYLAEQTKSGPNAYTYLRNMSVFRQLLCDLRSYLRREIAAGLRPEFDLLKLKNVVLSEEFEFLR